MGTMGIARTAGATVVRLVALAAGLAGYYAVLPVLFPDDGGGANIGAGLIAFALVMAASLVWGFLDGRARTLVPATVIWLVVAVAFGALWLLGLALVDADESLTLVERLRFDAFLGFHGAALVAVPAVIGAAVGGAAHDPADGPGSQPPA